MYFQLIPITEKFFFIKVLSTWNIFLAVKFIMDQEEKTAHQTIIVGD